MKRLQRKPLLVAIGITVAAVLVLSGTNWFFSSQAVGLGNSGLQIATKTIAGFESAFCLAPSGTPTYHTAGYQTYNQTNLMPASSSCPYIHVGEALVVTNSTTGALISSLVINSNVTNNTPRAGDWTQLVSYAAVSGTLFPAGAKLRADYWVANNSTSVTCVSACTPPGGAAPASGCYSWWTSPGYPYFERHFSECATNQIEAYMTFWFALVATVAQWVGGGELLADVGVIGALTIATVVAIDASGGFNGVYVYGYTSHGCIFWGWWCWTNYNGIYLWHN